MAEEGSGKLLDHVWVHSPFPATKPFSKHCSFRNNTGVLTIGRANGEDGEGRAGSLALTLLANPLIGAILRGLADGPKDLVDLRREAGLPAQSTMRTHLRSLEELDVIVRTRRNRFPGILECELTDSGRELLFVASTLERWLEVAPDGRLPFGSAAAKGAIKAMVEGWSTTMLRALAARPLSLTELDRVISPLNYPSLERRLSAMKLAGQVAACPGENHGTPYGVTDWLRRGIAPICAAARWERRHVATKAAPIGRLDIETSFLLAVPLLEVPADHSGSCRLGVELTVNGELRLAGALVGLEPGRRPSCTTRVEGDPDAWAIAPVNAWLCALIEADTDQVELGGDQRLARAVLGGLHATLFGAMIRQGAS